MKKPVSFFAVVTSLLALSLLSGCVQSIKMDKEQISSIKRIGVVSIIQDKFVVKHVGSTVFTNSEKEFDSPWQFNAEITEAIRSELAAYPYIFVDLKKAAGNFQGAYDKVNRFTATYVTYDHAPIKEELKKIAMDNSLDALILVTSHFSKDYVEQTDQTLKGYGLYKRSFLGSERAHIYFWGMMKILDGHTMELIALRPLGTQKKIETSFWKEDVALLSDEEKKTFESTIKAGIKDTIRVNLGRIGLIKCVPDDYYCSDPVSGEK